MASRAVIPTRREVRHGARRPTVHAAALFGQPSRRVDRDRDEPSTLPRACGSVQRHEDRAAVHAWPNARLEIEGKRGVADQERVVLRGNAAAIWSWRDPGD